MKQKKQWQKPALIVLVRRKPEEAVLHFCKHQADLGAFDLDYCEVDDDCEDQSLT